MIGLSTRFYSLLPLLFLFLFGSLHSSVFYLVLKSVEYLFTLDLVLRLHSIKNLCIFSTLGSRWMNALLILLYNYKLFPCLVLSAVKMGLSCLKSAVVISSDMTASSIALKNRSYSLAYTFLT